MKQTQTAPLQNDTITSPQSCTEILSTEVLKCHSYLNQNLYWCRLKKYISTVQKKMFWKSIYIIHCIFYIFFIDFKPLWHGVILIFVQLCKTSEWKYTVFEGKIEVQKQSW